MPTPGRADVRRRVVTGALDRDPKTFAACELDDRHDVFDGLGVRHGAGSLVDCEIPRPTRLIPLRIVRNDEPSRELCRRFQSSVVIAKTSNAADTLEGPRGDRSKSL